MKLSIERVVALLTPTFATAAGALSTGVGSVTGIPKQDYVALFGFGAASGLGIAWKWLHGRQRFVTLTGDVEKIVDTVEGRIKASQPASLALADVEQALRAHTDQIVTAIGSAVHAPPSVEEVAKQILDVAAGRTTAEQASEQTVHPGSPPPAI